MARLLLASVALLMAIVVVSEAFKFPLTSRHPIAVNRYVLHSIREMVHHVKRERRQSFNQKCIEDATAATHDPFKSCETEFQNIDNDQGEDNINMYCRHNCSNVMLDLFLKLKRDCGASAHQIDNSLLLYLNYSCDHDPKGRYCLYDWYNGDNLFPDADKEAYGNCADSYSPGSCPSGCTTALSDISRGFGCCYTVLYSASPTHQSANGTDLIPLSAFDDCRISKPGICTH